MTTPYGFLILLGTLELFSTYGSCALITKSTNARFFSGLEVTVFFLHSIRLIIPQINGTSPNIALDSHALQRGGQRGVSPEDKYEPMLRAFAQGVQS
jgi:hypothetical protein